MESASFNDSVYVFRIKATKHIDWAAPDLVYGLAHEGVDGLTFNMIKELAKKNKRCFLTKKVKATGEKCSSADMMHTLRDWKVIGDPKLTFLEKPTSWFAMATAVYSAGIFTDSDGFNDLETMKEGNKSGTGKPGETVGSSAASMFANARNQAEKIAASGVHSSFTDGLSQAERMLANPGFAIDKLEKEELLKIVDDYQIKVALIEEKNAALETTNAHNVCKIQNLEDKVKSLKLDLEASKKIQTGFMSVADRKAIEAETMKKTVSSLIESLRPMIVAELQPLRTSLESTSKSLQAVQTSCAGIHDLNVGIDNLASATEGHAKSVLCQIETCDEATNEVLNTIKNALVGATATKRSDITMSTLAPTIPCSTTASAPTNPIVFPPNMFTTPPPNFTGQGGVTGANSANGRGRGRGRGFLGGSRGTANGGGRGNDRFVVGDDNGDSDNNPGKTKKKHQRQKMQERKKLKQLATKSPLFGSSAENVADTVESMQQQLEQLQQYVQAQGLQ